MEGSKRVAAYKLQNGTRTGLTPRQRKRHLRKLDREHRMPPLPGRGMRADRVSLDEPAAYLMPAVEAELERAEHQRHLHVDVPPIQPYGVTRNGAGA